MQPDRRLRRQARRGVAHVANNEAPWVVTARIVSASFKVAGHAAGIVVQRAFNNAFVFLALGNSSSDTQFNLRLGSVNASSAETAILTEPNMYNWLRLGFDGNYVRAWVSSDGLLWQDFGSPIDASTALGGAPDRVGITNRSNAVHDGSVGGLVTYWEDPDFPATSRMGQGVVTLTMATLQDVDLLTSAPEDGQALVWDEVSETWVPGNAAGGGAETLDELTDVDVTTIPPTDGQVLRFDDATDTWKPGTVASGATTLDGLTDVDVSTTPPSDGQVLRFDDATDTWKPGTVSTGATNINALTDVDTATTAPTDGQALIWNNSAGQWKPGTVVPDEHKRADGCRHGNHGADRRSGAAVGQHGGAVEAWDDQHRRFRSAHSPTSTTRPRRRTGRSWSTTRPVRNGCLPRTC